jgi:hypothetical protein
LQVKSSGTTNALSDLVVPAKDEEKSPLFGAQKTRPTTIEMAKTTVAEDDGVVRQDRSRAVRARWLLLFHCRRPPRKWRTDRRIAPSPFSLNTPRFSTPGTLSLAPDLSAQRNTPVIAGDI